MKPKFNAVVLVFTVVTAVICSSFWILTKKPRATSAPVSVAAKAPVTLTGIRQSVVEFEGTANTNEQAVEAVKYLLGEGFEIVRVSPNYYSTALKSHAIYARKEETKQ